MAEKWLVKFTDDDKDGIQTVSFDSCDDAQKWIDNQEIQNRYDNVHFNVVDGPCKEDMLSEADDKKAEMSFKAFAKFVEDLNMEDVQQATIDAALVFISKMFNVDAQKFKDENPKLCKKLSEVISFSKDPSEKPAPVLAVHYPSTNVNLLLVANVPILEDKSFKSILKFGWKLFKKSVGYSALGLLLKDSSTFMMIPFKQDGDKIVHDTSENAYLQIAMTLLLSDIEFDTLWPTKALGSSFMKYLDFICPSLMDVIGLATFGGASIAARAAKLSAKAGAKHIAKAGAKKGIKKLSQKQLKLIAKVAKKAPKGAQKTIKKGHKALKKAKNASKLSRNMKDNLKGRGEASEEKDLAESVMEFSQSVHDLMTKIWVDDIRPAPEGYVWLKSVNEFIDYMVEHGIYGISVFDFDHDAGDYASDGGDYIKCLDWLEKVGADNINVRIHSANPVGAAKMKQIIKKNQWNEVFDVIEESLSRQQQIEMLFESIGPSEWTFGETWEELDDSSPAYSTAVDSAKVIDGLRIGDVYEVGAKKHFIAVLHGGDNGSLDRQKWLRYLESVKKFIAQMFKHGCGDVWLVDFINDCVDDVFTLRIGFNLLSSPFSSDGNMPLDEGEKSSKDSGQEDAKAKGKVIDALKDASKDFQKMASNNDPEQFAKIVVAFDDLAAGVGAYDFKKKKKLKEQEAEDGNR